MHLLDYNFIIIISNNIFQINSLVNFIKNYIETGEKVYISDHGLLSISKYYNSPTMLTLRHSSDIINNV